MKNFFDNLLGLIRALIFMAIPVAIIGGIYTVLNHLGVWEIALFSYDVFRIVVILFFIILSIGVILRGH